MSRRLPEGSLSRIDKYGRRAEGRSRRRAGRPDTKEDYISPPELPESSPDSNPDSETVMEAEVAQHSEMGPDIIHSDSESEES